MARLLGERQRQRIEWIKTDLFLAGIFVVYLALLKAFNITCPIEYLIGVRCPACGSSRGLACLLRLDFSGYYGYNYMSVGLALAVYCNAHEKFFNQKVLQTGTIAVGVLTAVRYILNLIY